MAKQQQKRRWINKVEFGFCRTFQHSYPAPHRKEPNYFIINQGVAYRVMKCVNCGFQKEVTIAMGNGKMKSKPHYPKGYLLKRKRKGEKLPSRAELRLEFVQSVTGR